MERESPHRREFEAEVREVRPADREGRQAAGRTAEGRARASLPIKQNKTPHWGGSEGQVPGAASATSARLDREKADGWEVERACGWDHVVTGKLDVIDVPGEHSGILQPPFVATVARQLRVALATAAAGGRDDGAPGG